MKKIFTIVITAFLLLTSCSSENESRQQNANGASSYNSTASYEKKEIEYDRFTVAESIVPNFGKGEVVDIDQVEKTLFVLTKESLYCLDLQTGTDFALAGRKCVGICEYAGKLYMFDGEKTITAVTQQYDTVDECDLVNFGSDWAVIDFVITDLHYVFLKEKLNSNNVRERQIAIYNRATGKEKLIKAAETRITALSKYKGDSVLALYVDTNNDVQELRSFDCADGKLEKIRDIVQIAFPRGFTYNKKADAVIVSGDILESHVQGIVELSLSSSDNVVLMKYDIPQENAFYTHLACYENIISIVPYKGNSLKNYDYCNPPKSLSVAFLIEESTVTHGLLAIISSYEAKNNIIIKTMSYADQGERIKLKMMAGDTDLDMIATYCIDEYVFLRAQMYCDLTEFSKLTNAIESNPFVKHASEYNGGYFGVPYTITEVFPDPDQIKYFVSNLSATEGRFDDENGEELYKLFKKHYRELKGENVSPLYDFDAKLFSAGYLMLTPYSANKEEAADFMKYVFDVLNYEYKCKHGTNYDGEPKDQSSIAECLDSYPFFYYNIYPDIEDASIYYSSMEYRPVSDVEPILTAYNSVSSSDGKDSTLKKMAKEAAAEVAMRIGE